MSSQLKDSPIIWLHNLRVVYRRAWPLFEIELKAEDLAA